MLSVHVFYYQNLTMIFRHENPLKLNLVCFKQHYEHFYTILQQFILTCFFVLSLSLSFWYNFVTTAIITSVMTKSALKVRLSHANTAQAVLSVLVTMSSMAVVVPVVGFSVTAYTATQICLNHVKTELTLLAMLDALTVRAVVTSQHTPDSAWQEHNEVKDRNSSGWSWLSRLGCNNWDSLAISNGCSW